MNIGSRVLRGPDWKWKDQDGGEGALGTVVDMSDKDKDIAWITILWDIGETNSYRASGSTGFDLRLYDNAPSGNFMLCIVNGIRLK